jgi:hypothetical protein
MVKTSRVYVTETLNFLFFFVSVEETRFRLIIFTEKENTREKTTKVKDSIFHVYNKQTKRNNPPPKKKTHFMKHYLP